MINEISNVVFGSSVLNNVFGNSIIVAIVIALLMIILIMLMYPAKAGTPFSVILRIFLYMCLGTSLIILLHNGVIKHRNEAAAENETVGGFADGFVDGGKNDPSYGSSHKFINPHAPMRQSMSPEPKPSTHTEGVSSTESKMDQESLSILGGILSAPKPPYAGGYQPNPYR